MGIFVHISSSSCTRMTGIIPSGNKRVCSKRTNYAVKRREQRRMEALEKLVELCKPEIGTGKAVSVLEFVQK